MKNTKNTPLHFTNVRIQDAFWAPRLAANRQQGLDRVYEQLQKTGRIEAYDLDWSPDSSRPKPHVFWDSDVAKWLEGACYSLMNHQDQDLLGRVESLVDRILSAQGEDGYLNPYYTVVEPENRWTNLRDRHELYCAGHMIEASIAHHQATGDRRFLSAMRRYADLIDRTFGPGKGQLRGYPGHQEIELALVKLYHHTGEKRYLNLAAYFVDARGGHPYYFDQEARQRREDPAAYWAKTHAYTQSHRPVREQETVVGHAVRAMYLYGAMADLAREQRDRELRVVLEKLWEDLVSHKLYLTGGIGTSRENEGFTPSYHLPNQDAYAETCAAIGLVFWAHRMLHLHMDSRYADVMERALYNAVLSGVSLEGDRFFYVNPLASDGTHQRQVFYSCSCCPPNINRLLPTIGGFVYSTTGDEITTHLYIQSEARIEFDPGTVTLIQETDYPWDGVVCIRCEMDVQQSFTLKLRKPGWCQEARLYLNGDRLPDDIPFEGGYFRLERRWKPGDEIRLQWLMPAHRVYAHPDVKATVDSVALMRGPIVYCLEALDQPVPLHLIRLPRSVSLESRFETDLLGGVGTLVGKALAADVDAWGGALYQPDPPDFVRVPFKAIPYYAWANREPGAMRVWLPEA